MLVCLCTHKCILVTQVWNLTIPMQVSVTYLTLNSVSFVRREQLMNVSQQHRTESKAWIMTASGSRKSGLFSRLKLPD